MLIPARSLSCTLLFDIDHHIHGLAHCLVKRNERTQEYCMYVKGMLGQEIMVRF
jgi:hypothetical protein